MPPQYMIEVKQKKQKRRNHRGRDLTTFVGDDNDSTLHRTQDTDSHSTSSKVNSNTKKAVKLGS